MASITGYTAEYMKAILDQTVKSISVDSVTGAVTVLKNDNSTTSGGNSGAINGVTQGTMNNAINATGKGIVAHVSYDVDQSFSGSIYNYYDVNGLLVTFTPTPNRYYRFSVYGVFVSSANNDMSIGLYNNTDAAFIGFSTSVRNPATGGSNAVSSSIIIKAPSNWNVPKTIRAKHYLRSTPTSLGNSLPGCAATLTVEDLGT